MTHVNPTDQELRQLLIHAKTIAMVGASSKPDRPSHGVMQRMLSAGYRVIPVNPRETEVLRQRAYPSLEEIGEEIDVVDVFRRAEQTPPIADEAVQAGAKVFWLQLGIASDEAADRALAGGLTVVMNACIAIVHRELQVPAKA